MGISMQSFNWTTLDELAFVQTIHRSKNIKLLRNYIRVCQLRSWTGIGMHVDPHEVLIHALELLDDLEGHKWMPRVNRPRGLQ